MCARREARDGTAMRVATLAFAMLMLASNTGDGALAQSSTAKKKAAPAAAQQAPQQQQGDAQGKPPDAKVVGSFGNWTLLCGKEGKDETAAERCSLVMPLIEKESQKLVFRVIITYGPKKNLVLRVDGPTGVALQRGVEFSPDAEKVYRMPFQTCLPMGCKALLVVSDDLKKELVASKQGAITVYALNGKAVKTLTEFSGFGKALAALDKRMAGQ